MTTIINVLHRPMASTAVPEWDGAQWIGLWEDAYQPPTGGRITLADADGHHTARLLVRHAGRVRGFVELPITAGSIDGAELLALASDLPSPDCEPLWHGRDLTFTVVLCTRDRADQLAVALASVLCLDHPAFEVVVVDNASATDATRALVTGLHDPRVRLVVEPRPGLARARNTGLRHATGEIVAFTDDDVVVDRSWLRRLAEGFSRADDVDCVTGLVPSGELRTPVQAYFDRRVSWSASCRGRAFRLAQPPQSMPLFPFQVGAYGTGANFALRRSAAFALGGFDEALGVGSPTQGGEDIDMFVRVVASGSALVVEPSALVWHRHRADGGELAHQAVGYGVGLGAWLCKVALDRQLAPLALRRGFGAVRRIRALGRLGTPQGPDVDGTGTSLLDELKLPADSELRAELARVARAERSGVLRGPLRYLRARAGTPRRPLDVPIVESAVPMPVHLHSPLR